MSNEIRDNTILSGKSISKKISLSDSETKFRATFDQASEEGKGSTFSFTLPGGGRLITNYELHKYYNRRQ